MEMITITIETGNAAFDDAPATEIARILHDIAYEFEEYGGRESPRIRDLNGNVCGSVTVTKKEA